jgi:ketosteroid isomerase-like protein
MSDAAANKAILESAYRRWHETRGQCIEELLHIYDDNVRFGSLAQGAAPAAFTMERTCKEEMRGYFDGLLAAWNMLHYTVHDMIAEGDRVAVVCSTAWTNKATGKTVETPKVDVWRFKDGRAVEFYEYYDTAKLFAAATPG